ncbi:MAG: extracellular solute-binding protein, partial [Chloroflexota bacterium]
MDTIDQGEMLTRRKVVLATAPAAVIGGALGAACTVGGTPSGAPPPKASGLSGTFDFTVQNFQPTINIIEKPIDSFQEKHPEVKITYTPVGYGEMATKTKSAIAAGAAPDGYHTYSGFWRGVDAATV